MLTIVIAFLAIDLSLGALLTGTNALPGQRGDTRRTILSNVAMLMAAPPISGEPWAPSYRDDLSAFELRASPFVPYVISGFDEFQSASINTTARGRRSYRPSSSAGVEPLRVAFFGGSTMFGVGQRDEHTIASEVARIAEEDGVPLEVANYGHLDWVSWQEQQYLERLLSRDGPFDLVVFYDGFEDLQVQQADFSVDPTHADAPVFRQLTRDYHAEHSVEPGFADDVAGLLSSYRRASGIFRVVDHLTGHDSGEPSDGVEASPNRRAEAALEIYRRSTTLVDDLARDHETPVQLFWQPVRSGWDRSITARLPPGTVDLSGVFGDRSDDVYLDDVHTNEPGAHLVAEAMWEEIGPQLKERAAAN